MNLSSCLLICPHCKCILQISMHTLEAHTNLCQEMSVQLIIVLMNSPVVLCIMF